MFVFLPSDGIYCVSDAFSKFNKGKAYWFGSREKDDSAFIYFDKKLLRYEENKIKFDFKINLDNERSKEYNLKIDENTVDIIVMLFGQKYEDYFIKSVDSMIKNQNLDGTSQNLRFWLPKNHLTQSFRQRIMKIWTWDPNIKIAQVWVEIKLFSYKWFEGLFDNSRTIAEEIQLARIMLVPILLPSEMKTVVIKDADQIMQSGNIQDYLIGNFLKFSHRSHLWRRRS